MKRLIFVLAFLILSALAASAQTITAPRISLSGPSAFEAVIQGADLSNIAAWQADIYYDPNVIALRYTDEAHNFGCATTGISSGMAIVCNGYEAGRLFVEVYGAYGFSGSGDLLSTQWVTVESGYTDLHFANARMWSWTNHGEIYPRWEDGSVSIGNNADVCSVTGC